MNKKAIAFFAISGIILTGLCFGCSKAVTEPPAATAPSAAQGDLVYLKAQRAVASSFEDTPDWAPRPDPMAPVDGNLATRWSPQLGSDNEWIYFDLGKEKTLSKAIVRWEDAYATKYEVLVSGDAKQWRPVALKEGGKGGAEELTFNPVRARYVKVVGLKRVNPEWGFSIWEFEMYGPKEANPQDKTLEETFPWRGEAAREAAKKVRALGITKGEIVPSPGPITPQEFQKGVNYTSWNSDELESVTSDESLVYLADLGVKEVALMVVWYQESAEADSVSRDPQKTVSDAALGHAVSVCHKLGMKVKIKPHVDLEDGEFRTNILPNPKWFKSYQKFILTYADFSEKHRVELFSIGTELSNTGTETWHAQWSDIIREVRARYRGPIVYDANWDDYTTVSFWNEVDFIGIDAYFPLTNSRNPTKGELVKGWGKRADEIERWLKESGLAGKPLIFTEVGYDAIEGSNMQPWRVLPTLAGQKEDQDEQADCLDAMMTVLSGRSWFKGFYWWNYFPRPDIGALGYTLRGKKGEKVLVDWFKKVR